MSDEMITQHPAAMRIEKYLQNKLEEAEAKLALAEEKLAVAVESLGFYTSEENFSFSDEGISERTPESLLDPKLPWWDDFGAFAREALQKIEGKEGGDGK